MQDAYAFDVGDFGKVGLLRLLCLAADLRLGVHWYRTNLKSKADDGKHRSYLTGRRANHYRECDRELFEAFARAYKEPSIAALQRLDVWPRETVFVSDETPSGSDRAAWFKTTAGHLRGAGLVFCDPDNGIAKSGSELERIASAKHILLSEVADLFRAGHSLVLYHHLNREKGVGHLAQMQRWMATLSDAVGTGSWVSSVRFRRGSGRAFFILSQAGLRASLEGALSAYSESAWARRRHAEVVPLLGLG